MEKLTVDEKYNLITRNLQEVIGDETIIKKIIDKRPLKIYWGTAPTGQIHIGYLVPLLKIADFLKTGCEVTILIANIHAFLDNKKSELKQLEYRTEYYTTMIKTILTSLNIDIEKLKFINGNEYQTGKKYTMDVYKACSIVTLNNAKHAGAEVVKQSDNPKMNGLLYPILQCLDEEYLDVDVQFGGIDQRKIFMLSRDLLPKLGYKKRFHFMNEIVPGLRFEKLNKDTDTKMSASNLDSKIDMLESKTKIKKKINKTYCLSGEINDNSLLVLLEKVIFPILNNKKLKFIINRKEEYGGIIEYENYEDIKNDILNNKLHPGDFKLGIINSLNLILLPIQNIFSTKEMMNIVKIAYT